MRKVIAAINMTVDQRKATFVGGKATKTAYTILNKNGD